MLAYELAEPTRAVSSSPELLATLLERGWYTFPTFTRREVALMGSSRWVKALRFVLCLLGALAFLLYIVPIKAY